MAKRNKNNVVLLCLVLVGLVIGGLIGELVGKFDELWWLGYGKQFGFTHPIFLDLNVIKLTFSIILKINIASILGVIITLFLYKKL